jgi:hypothetical protein
MPFVKKHTITQGLLISLAILCWWRYLFPSRDRKAAELVDGIIQNIAIAKHLLYDEEPRRHISFREPRVRERGPTQVPAIVFMSDF